MNEHIPAWRTAWRLDDSAWVRQRKQNWKCIKNSPAIERLFMPSKDELKKIKYFYLTGSAYDPEPPEEDWRWLSYHPDKRPVSVGYGMLIELWLTADDSDGNFQHIYGKYREGSILDARNTFRDALHRLYPEYGSIFDGREVRIYKLLGPTRCRMEDYPNLSSHQFLSTCNAVCATLGMPIYAYLNSESSEEDALIPLLVDEWCDSLHGAYEYNIAESKELDRPEFLDVFVRWILEIVKMTTVIAQRPEQRDSERSGVAAAIIECLSKMTLPESLVTKIIKGVGDK